MLLDSMNGEDDEEQVNAMNMKIWKLLTAHFGSTLNHFLHHACQRTFQSRTNLLDDCDDDDHDDFDWKELVSHAVVTLRKNESERQSSTLIETETENLMCHSDSVVAVDVVFGPGSAVVGKDGEVDCAEGENTTGDGGGSDHWLDAATVHSGSDSSNTAVAVAADVGVVDIHDVGFDADADAHADDA